MQRREQLLQLKVKELREELAGNRKEVRHLKKAAKTLEVGEWAGEGRAGLAHACMRCAFAGAGFTRPAVLPARPRYPESTAIVHRHWRWLGSPPRHRPSNSVWWSVWWRCPMRRQHAGWSVWRRNWHSWRRSGWSCNGEAG